MKLGRGVLGRIMPFAIVTVIFEAIAATLLAFAVPEDLTRFIYTSLCFDFVMFMVAFIWAHLHPVEAASEGKEIAEIRHAEASATKMLGTLPQAENIPDPRMHSLEAPAPTIGELVGEAHARLVEQPALPKPNIVSAGKKVE